MKTRNPKIITLHEYSHQFVSPFSFRTKSLNMAEINGLTNKPDNYVVTGSRKSRFKHTKATVIPKNHLKKSDVSICQTS
jgi:hypothetical protein